MNLLMLHLFPLTLYLSPVVLLHLRHPFLPILPHNWFIVAHLQWDIRDFLIPDLSHCISSYNTSIVSKKLPVPIPNNDFVSSLYSLYTRPSYTILPFQITVPCSVICIFSPCWISIVSICFYSSIPIWNFSFLASTTIPHSCWYQLLPYSLGDHHYFPRLFPLWH